MSTIVEPSADEAQPLGRAHFTVLFFHSPLQIRGQRHERRQRGADFGLASAKIGGFGPKIMRLMAGEGNRIVEVGDGLVGQVQRIQVLREGHLYFTVVGDDHFGQSQRPVDNDPPVGSVRWPGQVA